MLDGKRRFAASQVYPRPLFSMVLLEDANAVQVALMQVLQMLGSGRIDPKNAGLMLYGLQTASCNLRHTKFEAEKPTDVVIDRNTVDLTCINGPQWFARDFAEIAETETGETEIRQPAIAEVATREAASREETSGVTTEASAGAKPAAKGEKPRVAGGARLRKKPDPVRDTPDFNSSLAGILLQRMGLVPGNGGYEDEDQPGSQMNRGRMTREK
jgi:hypothetical protein